MEVSKKIYLAGAYSDKDPQVMEDRYHKHVRCAAYLTSKGHNVFSPIAHSHPISKLMDNSTEHDVWLWRSMSFLDWADALYVIDLQDCKESRGVKQEFNSFKKLYRPIYSISEVSHWERTPILCFADYAHSDKMVERFVKEEIFPRKEWKWMRR